MERIFSPSGCVEQLLRFEAALARAQARAGVIPHDAARAINAACDVELFDAAAISRDAARTGTPVVPLLRQLWAKLPNGTHGYLHVGATSQDAGDTALVIQMRAGIDVLVQDLRSIGTVAALLAESHRRSVMPGRTFLQHAVPITFGLKAARWLAAVVRQLRNLESAREQLTLQFGGAGGTLAALAPNGIVVAELLAEELHLTLPDLPWHAERDRPATIACALGVTAGVLGKIATDIVLLSQNEVAEVAEGQAEGKGVSSAMPQKRNPVDAVEAIAGSRLAIGIVPVILAAMSQEHERGAGGWQTEWQAIPDLFRHTSRASRHVLAALSGLEVFPERMRENIDVRGGALMAESLVVALAASIARPEAQRLVGDLAASALKTGASLLDVARVDERVTSVLSSHAIESALNPAAYLGSSDALIDRALQSWRNYETQAAR